MKNKYIKTIAIIFLSLLVIFFIIKIVATMDDHKRRSYKLDIKFEKNSIVSLSNKLPISDEIGKNYDGTGMERAIAGYSEFTVSNINNDKVNYEIYLTKIHNNVNDIRSNYIKLYLTDENNNPIEGFDKKQQLSYYDLFALNDKPGSKLLFKDSLNALESKKFILRSWVSDTYILSNVTEDFDFEVYARLK